MPTDTLTIPATNAFLDYLIQERHFSKYTARCYGVDLRQFLDWILESENITPNESLEKDVFEAFKTGSHTSTKNSASITEYLLCAGTEDIRNYLATLTELRYSPATMARKIASLRSFYRWAEKRRLAKEKR